MTNLLLRKAAQDEFVLRLLVSNPQSPREEIGFHAQQAVEKLPKAVLAGAGVRYRRTHDLVELMDLLRQNGMEIPSDLEQVRLLTPFATQFRYELFPEVEPFDYQWALDCVAKTRAWADRAIKEGGE